MIAANIMTSDVVAIAEGASVADAFRLIRGSGIRQLPVLDDENRLVGVITPQALMKAVLPKYVAEGMVADVRFAPEPPEFAGNIDALAGKALADLRDSGFTSVTPDTTVMEVAAVMVDAKKHAESIFVVDDRGTLLGIISPWDIFTRLWEYSGKK